MKRHQASSWAHFAPTLIFRLALISGRRLVFVVSIFHSRKETKRKPPKKEKHT
jgi:hypothetical protein